MVDQAQVTPQSARSELPPRKVAQSTAEFFHDVAALGELQAQLALIELRQSATKLLAPVIVLVAGVAIGLGAVPIALAALALTLVATTELSLPASFGIALAVGLVLCALLVAPAIVALRHRMNLFERSRYELGRNIKWVKDTLQRLSQGPPPSAVRPPHSPW
jgi:uncharacterized membrane protein YciS (DUF1049 family)